VRARLSYVLQALKRAEEDLRAQPAAGPEQPARPAAAPAGPHRDAAPPDRRPPLATASPWGALDRLRAWPWLAGGGLALALNVIVFGAFVLGTRPSGPAVVAPPPAAVEEAEPPTAAEAPAMPAPAAEGAAAPAEPSPADVVARARPRPEIGSSRPRPGETTDVALRRGMPAATAPQPGRAIAPPTVSVRPAPAPGAPVAPEPEIVPEEPWVPELTFGARRHRAARAALGEPRPATAPSASPAPAEADAEVESRPRIEVLVWAADPGKRMVYLNGRRYAQGEALQNGAVIEEILPDGVILVYRGQRTRLPSQAR